VNRSASNQSPEKRQKPPLRFLEHDGVFAYHKALTVFRSNDGNPERRSNPKRNIYGHRAGWPTTGTTDQIFKGRKVVLFGVAGAFTPVCGKHHLPGFLENLDQFKAQGVDEIAVTGVSDIFVMEAWAKSAGADGKISFLADGNGDFARALGLSLDLTARGLGIRSQRYAMIVDNGVVRKLNLEAAPGKVETSSAETLLKQL
jgi:peroxiredoxin